MPANITLIHQDSGQTEWYTPSPVVEAARAVMGGIDLDPASSAAANETVQAATYFSRADDGLAQPWAGRVFLNPPFSDAARFISKLMAERAAGRVTEACVVTFASLDTAWARTLALYPRWYPDGRLSYVPGWEAAMSVQMGLPGLVSTGAVDLRAVTTQADAPPKASMVTYIGPDDGVQVFAALFPSRLGGWVDVPWSFHTHQHRQLRGKARDLAGAGADR